MELGEILKWAVGAIFVAMTTVEISPLKLNPWSRIAKIIGRAFNRELLDEIAGLKKDVVEVKEDITVVKDEGKQRDAISARVRVLRFADEQMRNIKHSKDHFDQTMVDIDTYEQYCDTHKDFRNSITIATIARVRASYAKRLENNDFL